jgi:hypothetical protein
VTLCAREGCNEPARKRFCGPKCARSEQNRRARAKHYPALDLTITVTITREEARHEAFGVETSEDVEWIFEDDRRRFRR